jgi:hypothetical protein
MDMKIQGIIPKTPTDQELKEAFPDALPIIDEKISEWEEKRDTLISEVGEAVERGKGYDPVTRGVCLEIWKLNLNPQFAEIERHLWRLRRLRESYLGGVRRDQVTPYMIARAREFPIESLAESKVRKFGKRSRMLCPLHQEKTPSFTIYPDNRWHCFGACARGGDVIDFLQLHRGLNFQDAVKFLAGRTS